jgi:WD40 repeat protein
MIGLAADSPDGVGSPVVVDLVGGGTVVLASHEDRVIAMALDATGSVAVTGDWEGAIWVGPVSGETPHLLTASAVPVTSVDISPDGRWIASGHGDGTIRLWAMPDLDEPPLNGLPRRELLARLRSMTNLRVVPDPESPGYYRVRAVGPFPGWEAVSD